MTAQIVVNLVIALIWMLLQDTPSLNQFIFGYLLGAGVLYYIHRQAATPFYLRRVVAGIELVVIFLYEVAWSSLRVAYLLAHPKLPINPGLLALPLDARSDVQITMLAGMITMTPGTLSVEVSHDRSHLFIHALELDDPTETAQTLKKKFERRILEVVT